MAIEKQVNSLKRGTEIMAKDTCNSHVMLLANNRSQLTMNGDKSVIYQSPIKCPNWWWRLWQWLFFGFRWENIEKE